jgi:Transglutaminase-like superfamily
MTTLTKLARLFFAASRKFVSKPGEAWLLCRMACWVGVLSAAAKCWSLPRALQLVSGRQSRQLHCNDIELQNRLACSIDLLLSANVLVFKPICWKRAAVLRRYLSRNGVATRILFGVRNEAEGVVGHAWLESNGKPILEKSPPEYVITYSFPSDELYEPQLAILSSE